MIKFPELEDLPPVTAKQQKELQNTLAVFKEGGARKTKRDYTEWGVNRQRVVEKLFYMYLFSKYGNSCPIYIDEIYNIYIYIHLDPKDYQGMRGFLFKKYENMILKDTITGIKKCLDSGKSLVVCPISLQLSGSRGHANLLIFRKDSRSIEVFEPHGQAFGDSKEVPGIVAAYTAIADKFNRGLKEGEKYTLYLPDVVCPEKYGFQSLESLSWIQKEDFEGGGYCAVWSMFMTEMLLMNPNMTTTEIISQTLNAARKDDGKFSIHGVGKYMQSLVRGYTTYVTRQIERYFTLIYGERLMKAIRHGEAKPKPEDIKLVDYTFNSYCYIVNYLTLNPKETLQTLYDKLEKKKRKTIFKKRGMYENIFHVIRAMQKEEFGNYTPVGHHTPALIESIVHKKRCAKGEVRNNYGVCVKPSIKKTDPKSKKLSPVLETPKAKRQTKKQPPVKKHSPIKKKSPVKKQKVCPPGKELNLKTNRCNKIKETKKKAPVKKTSQTKKCPPGKILNPKTNRCNKLKPVKKINKTVEAKKCPPGKELNLKTNRCNIKKPKATKKAPVRKTAQIKQCPPGKELNKATNRCRKIIP